MTQFLLSSMSSTTAVSVGPAARQPALVARPQLRSASRGLCSRSNNVCSHHGAAQMAPQQPLRHSCQQRAPPARRRLAPPAAIRAVESFDGKFELEQQQKETLEELLNSELFCQQVVRDCKLPEETKVAYTGVLFQPVPWSPATKKGMPAEIEQQYYGKPDQFTVINVPPVFMFKAKIFSPPRLCAIYKHL